MNEIKSTLEKYADDTDVSVRSFDSTALSLDVLVASRGNEKWIMTVNGVIHLDLSPSFILGKEEFGNIDLLPDNYMQSRNFDFGGDVSKYNVIKFVDVDGNYHIVVFYGEESIVKVSV